MTAHDIRHMSHALELAARGSGRVWPNPAVGCVIVAGHRVVGRGWTQDGGRPHAETMALMQAGTAARGATAFVTLEPCAHHGKTPPCADALIAAGVARVVVAMDDPDRRVNGAGLDRLRAAGIVVDTGVCEARAQALQAGFVSRITRGRPMVTLKLAVSLDGRIATASGESRWITGPGARRAVHAMRARHDAVLVGGGTARADDPSLDVRGLGVDRQPVRVVFSRGLDLPLTGRLAATACDVPVWICHGADADPGLVQVWTDLSARLFAVPGGRALDAGAALQALGKAGLTRVFCEGGGALAASLLQAGLVDRLVVFGAGVALGAEGRAALGPLGLSRLDAAPRFDLLESRVVDGDVMNVWAVRR